MPEQSLNYGTLFRIKPQTGSLLTTPIIEFLAAPDVERTEAETIADREFRSWDWNGPKQALFMHRDGTVELWNHQNISSK